MALTGDAAAHATTQLASALPSHWQWRNKAPVALLVGPSEWVAQKGAARWAEETPRGDAAATITNTGPKLPLGRPYQATARGPV